jgi:hypothetical protein
MFESIKKLFVSQCKREVPEPTIKPKKNTQCYSDSTQLFEEKCEKLCAKIDDAEGIILYVDEKYLATNSHDTSFDYLDYKKSSDYFEEYIKVALYRRRQGIQVRFEPVMIGKIDFIYSAIKKLISIGVITCVISLSAKSESKLTAIIPDDKLLFAKRPLRNKKVQLVLGPIDSTDTDNYNHIYSCCTTGTQTSNITCIYRPAHDLLYRLLLKYDSII